MPARPRAGLFYRALRALNVYAGRGGNGMKTELTRAAMTPALSVIVGLTRDVRAIAVCVVAAVTAVYCLPTLVSPLWCLPGLVLCLLRFPGRVLFVAVLIAVAWSLIDAQHRMADRLPVSEEHTVRPLLGRVVGLPEAGPRRTRFMLAPFEGPLRQLRLSWYDDAPSLMPGDCVSVAAKLSTPHGSANPGGFDYAAWLWRNRIDATGYVRRAEPCHRAPIWTVDRLRALALRRIDGILADSPVRGIVEALTLGVREHITDAQWQTLRATGTSHLVAISGLHIGLIATLLFVLARWLALRWPARLPADAIAALVALAGAAGYAAMAGWALPTQRALIMVAAGLFAVSSAREIDAGRALAFAAVAVVFWEPASVVAAGFWLSFAAVGWLIFLGQGARGPWWQQALRMQLGLVVALMPLTLWFFGQASITAPLVNALLIPAAGVFVPLLLFATLTAFIWPTLGALLLQVMAALLAKAWPMLAWVASWPAASFNHALPDSLMLLLGLIALVWLFVPRGFPARWLAGVLLLPLIAGWHGGAATDCAGRLSSDRARCRSGSGQRGTHDNSYADIRHRPGLSEQLRCRCHDRGAVSASYRTPEYRYAGTQPRRSRSCRRGAGDRVSASGHAAARCQKPASLSRRPALALGRR